MFGYLRKDRLFWIPVSLFVFLAAVFIATSIYLERQENSRQHSKAQAVAQQVASSIEVFSADRLRAIENLMLSWPANHPNPVDWFNAYAVTIRNVLPGFDDIIWADQSQLIHWNIKEPDRDYLRHQALNSLGLQINPSSDDFASTLTMDDKGLYYAVVGRAINPYEPRYGYVVASFDIQSTLFVMVGELVGDQFNFAMLDGDNMLMENGVIKDSNETVEQTIAFAKRQWRLKLQTNHNALLVSRGILAVGLLMSLFLCIFVYRQLRSTVKLSDSQTRYQAASESSLDAILVFQDMPREHSCGADFRLVEANKVALTMFGSERIGDQELRLSDLLNNLHLSEQLAYCVRVCETGEPYETSLSAEQAPIAPNWIKVQVVKAGNGIAMTVRDISARVSNQQRLKQSEEKYRRLIDGLDQHFIYSLGADGELSFISNSVADILDMTADEFHERHATLNCTYPDNIDEIRAKLHRGERPGSYRVTYVLDDGRSKVIEYNDSPVLDEQGQLIAIEGIGRDISEDLQLQQQVAYQANHDQLTGLYNRYAFDHKLASLLDRIKAEGSVATLCFMDMDQFKLVNDTCGHQAGDELLRQVSSLLAQMTDQHGQVARIGGDEFCLLYTNKTVQQSVALLEELLDAIRSFRFFWEGKLFHIGASIGVVEINRDAANASALLKAADDACYAAKNLGRNQYKVHEPSDEDVNQHNSELEWVSQIQKALEEDRFELFHQRIEPLNREREGLHYEILVRMQDEQGNFVSPGVFIPVAERYGLMTKLDQWVFEHTLEALEDNPWHLNQLSKCAINLSGVTLSNDYLLQKIVRRLQESSVPAEKICFEITETSAVTNLAAASNFIDSLRKLGCKFALDDFGAGMSSFTYLKNMAVDYVKIDGSFVKDICNDQSDFATVKAIHEIASSMGKRTVAEFVSSEQTRQCLSELGICYGQGFALHKPEPFVPSLQAPLAAKRA